MTELEKQCDDCVYALKDEHDHPCDRCFNESNWVENHSIALLEKGLYHP
jgi:hypothetical protein